MGATFGRGLNHNSDRNTGAEFGGTNRISHKVTMPVAFLCCKDEFVLDYMILTMQNTFIYETEQKIIKKILK